MTACPAAAVLCCVVNPSDTADNLLTTDSLGVTHPLLPTQDMSASSLLTMSVVSNTVTTAGVADSKMDITAVSRGPSGPEAATAGVTSCRVSDVAAA